MFESSTLDLFVNELKKIDIQLTDKQLSQFYQFYQLLVEKNKVMNLTRIVDEKDAIIKHFIDALSLSLAIDDCSKPLKVIDVGAGGGIPGVPLAIAFPHWHVTMIDSVGKKMTFVNEAIEALNIPAIAIHARAEELASLLEHRDRYDLATARAVAALPELAELCSPFVQKNGNMVISKGQKASLELEEADLALKTLNLCLKKTVSYSLAQEAGERTLYRFSKTEATPRGFPRKVGLAHHSPIVKK
jgi:16S rRNA (guanine527-N7)-methyltransferase